MDNSNMEIEEARKTKLFLILRQVIRQEPAASSISLTQEEFDTLMKVSKRHEVQPLVAYGLLLAGGLTQAQEQSCRGLIYRTMVYQERMERELRRTSSLLEAAGISYMPLKGAVIRKFYPEPWLRTSGDIDILVRDMDQALALLTENGYVRKSEDTHGITLISPGGVAFELHFLLMEKEKNPRISALLDQIWEYAHPVEDSCRFEMEPEILYFYHIAHMSNHMMCGGCGIRFFVDIWLLKEKLLTDNAKKEKMLQEGGIAVFSAQAEALSQMWFDTCQPDPVTLALEEYILNGGIYGSRNNMLMIRRGKTEKAVQYYLLRLFLPYRQMTQLYPELKTHPWLLPVYWVRRWITRFTNRKNLGNALQELTLDQNSVADAKRLFQQLELL